MKKDVSGNTILFTSELTSGYVCRDVLPPSISFIIKKTKLRYVSLIAQNELNALGTQNEAKIKKYDIKKKNYETKLELFFKTIKNIPKGFSLKPTMYTRITREQNDKIAKEFYDYVRPRFLIYLAEKHGKELLKAGFCQNGINRMKNGLDPADKDRKFYNFTVDHIIERSGSGQLGYDKSFDVKTGKKMQETYKVNHFSNLIFMPESIHLKIKNAINQAQDLPSMYEGQSIWSISVVPTGETEAKSSVYVAESPEDLKRHVQKHKKNSKSVAGSLPYLAKQIKAEVQLLITQHKNNEISDNSLKHNFNHQFNQESFVYKRRIIPLFKEMTDIINTIDQNIDKERNFRAKKEISKQLKRALYSREIKTIYDSLEELKLHTGKQPASNFLIARKRILAKHCHKPNSDHRR